MPPDPTALLEAAKREAKRLVIDVDLHQASPSDVHAAIDRAVRIAEKVGEIRGHNGLCPMLHGERQCNTYDRLLAELEGM